ncbi:anaerobic dimethyl sulfoxide reductase subunit C, partial [Klebsiella pneumoniae subsp. pneumoniae KPNIH21]|uniref:DmsC/YnfH family molybdoenzyme membrane anchor subunit n=1 Tax=Klebsiella pneumoniae TaxID=573 RepID=UPI00026F45B1
HLGSPLRAFNSLNRVGASSLSNEIASGRIFFRPSGGKLGRGVLAGRAKRTASPARRGGLVGRGGWTMVA